MSENNFDVINARVTFKNIPLHKLEKFSFKDLTAANEAFKKIPNISECVIIQNAFRVEVFMVVNLETGDTPDARRIEGRNLTIHKIEETWQSLTELGEHDIDHFDQTLEVYKNRDVYLNLLRLATGLDSIIVGREEIMDEIREAVTNSKLSKSSGIVLNKMFEHSLRVADIIRKESGIGQEIISIGDVAVNTTEEKIGISGKHVLLIGTGETAALVAKAMNKKEYAFDVTSLTIDRATSFSKLLGGNPVEFEEVLSGFDKFDIVFVATTADYFLINYDRLRLVMQNKKEGTLIVDISDPRAVDEKVATFPGMKLMFRDQISELVVENERARKGKVPAVEKSINTEVPILEATINRLEAESLVTE